MGDLSFPETVLSALSEYVENPFAYAGAKESLVEDFRGQSGKGVRLDKYFNELSNALNERGVTFPLRRILDFDGLKRDVGLEVLSPAS